MGIFGTLDELARIVAGRESKKESSDEQVIDTHTDDAETIELPATVYVFDEECDVTYAQTGTYSIEIFVDYSTKEIRISDYNLKEIRRKLKRELHPVKNREELKLIEKDWQYNLDCAAFLISSYSEYYIGQMENIKEHYENLEENKKSLEARMQTNLNNVPAQHRCQICGGTGGSVKYINQRVGFYGSSQNYVWAKCNNVECNDGYVDARRSLEETTFFCNCGATSLGSEICINCLKNEQNKKDAQENKIAEERMREQMAFEAREAEKQRRFQAHQAHIERTNHLRLIKR